MGIFGKDGSTQDYLTLELRVLALEEAVARLAAAQAGQGASGVQDLVPGRPQAADEASWQATARDLKAQGKTIHAVKHVREATGWGLKEAKDFVDAL